MSLTTPESWKLKQEFMVCFAFLSPFTRVSREPLSGDLGDFMSSGGWEPWAT